MRSKELRSQRAKLIEDARALIAADEVTDEANAKFDDMMAEADKLMARIEKLEKADALAAQTEEALRATADRRGVSVDEQRDTAALEMETFNAYIRGGMNALNEDQRRLAAVRFKAAQSTGTGSEGGYTVPTGFYDQLMEAQKAYGGMLNASFVFDTTLGNELPIPTVNDTGNVGAIISENTQVSSQDVTFGVVTLNAYTYTSKLVLVSNQLLQDSAFDLNAFLANAMGVRIARAVNQHFTTGDGSGKPTGAVTAATAGPTGATGETTSIIYEDLVELEHSVDPAYRMGAKFMFADSTLKVLKKLKDGYGRPLWLPGIAVKEPDTINGYGYVINQDMPAMAASAKSVLFGDFSKYFIRRVAGVQVLRLTERYADFNQTGFIAFQRWDGDLVDAGTHPLKYFSNASA